jgi:hypothetical protein
LSLDLGKVVTSRRRSSNRILGRFRATQVHFPMATPEKQQGAAAVLPAQVLAHMAGRQQGVTALMSAEQQLPMVTVSRWRMVQQAMVCSGWIVLLGMLRREAGALTTQDNLRKRVMTQSRYGELGSVSRSMQS